MAVPARDWAGAILHPRTPNPDPVELSDNLSAVAVEVMWAAPVRSAEATHRRRTSIPDLVESSCSRLTGGAAGAAARWEMNTTRLVRHSMQNQ